MRFGILVPIRFELHRWRLAGLHVLTKQGQCRSFRLTQAIEVAADGIEQVLDALSRCGRDGIKFERVGRAEAGESLELPGIVHGVKFGRDNDPWFAGNLFAVGRQFRRNGLKVSDGVLNKGRDIDEMEKDLGPFNVAQEAVTETRSGVGPLDQAGNIGHHEGLVFTEVDDTEVWFEGCERIVGNLWTRGGDARDEGRFAGIGQTDQPHIGNQLQFENEEAFLPGFPLFVAPRRTVGRSCKLRIASSTNPTGGDEQPLSWFDEISDHFTRLFVHDQRADRDEEGNVITVGAVPAAAFTVSPPPCLVFRVVAKVEKSIEPFRRFEVDRAATPAIPTRRASAWNKLLAAESGNSVSPISAANMDSCPVDKHCKTGEQCSSPPDLFARRPEGGLFYRVDADEAPLPATILKLDETVRLGIERIIAPDADVVARLEARSTLANEDRSTGDQLAPKALHPETLCR